MPDGSVGLETVQRGDPLHLSGLGPVVGVVQVVAAAPQVRTEEGFYRGVHAPFPLLKSRGKLRSTVFSVRARSSSLCAMAGKNESEKIMLRCRTSPCRFRGRCTTIDKNINYQKNCGFLSRRFSEFVNLKVVPYRFRNFKFVIK